MKVSIFPKIAAMATVVFAGNLSLAKDPSAMKIDFNNIESNAYKVALSVADVKSFFNEETQASITVRTIVNEGHLNSNNLLLQVNAQDGNEIVYLVRTGLAAVGSPLLRWENVHSSSTGLYLTLKGQLHGEAKKNLVIILTDSTGAFLQKPTVYFY